MEIASTTAMTLDVETAYWLIWSAGIFLITCLWLLYIIFPKNKLKKNIN